MKKILAIAIVSALSPAFASAAEFDQSKLYAGGSLTNNVVDSPFGGGSASAIGFAGFAGYELDNNFGDVTTSIEAGYSTTDDFYSGFDSDISGLWVAGVVQKTLDEINPQLFAIARLGLDLGDDDGLLMGAGAGFQLNEQLDLRAEFINKDASSVYQVSAVFNF